MSQPSVRPTASLPPEKIPQQLTSLIDEAQAAQRRLLGAAAGSQRAQDEINLSLLPRANRLEEALKRALPDRPVTRGPSSERPSEEVQTITRQMYKVHEELQVQLDCIRRYDAEMRKYESQLRQLRNALRQTLIPHQQNPKVSGTAAFRRAEAILRERPTVASDHV
jgi:chaperonin cofactor prefoldin